MFKEVRRLPFWGHQELASRHWLTPCWVNRNCGLSQIAHRIAEDGIPLPGGNWSCYRMGCPNRSPGMREIQLTGDEIGLKSTYEDIESIAQKCRFRDCRHSGEPGCKIQAAMEEGLLDPSRYRQYEKLKGETMVAKARRSERVRSEKRAPSERDLKRSSSSRKCISSSAKTRMPKKSGNVRMICFRNMVERSGE